MVVLETSIESFVKSVGDFGDKRDRKISMKYVIGDMIWNFSDLAETL